MESFLNYKVFGFVWVKFSTKGIDALQSSHSWVLKLVFFWFFFQSKIFLISTIYATCQPIKRKCRLVKCWLRLPFVISHCTYETNASQCQCFKWNVSNEMFRKPKNKEVLLKYLQDIERGAKDKNFLVLLVLKN